MSENKDETGLLPEEDSDTGLPDALDEGLGADEEGLDGILDEGDPTGETADLDDLLKELEEDTNEENAPKTEEANPTKEDSPTGPPETLQEATQEAPAENAEPVKDEEPESKPEETPIEEPMAEETPVEEPKQEEPPAEEPKPEETPIEEPKAEEVPVEEPKQEETPIEEPKQEETPVEEPKAEEVPVEEPQQEEAPVEEPKAEETPAEETKNEEAPADDLNEEDLLKDLSDSSSSSEKVLEESGDHNGQDSSDKKEEQQQQKGSPKYRKSFQEFLDRNAKSAEIHAHPPEPERPERSPSPPMTPTRESREKPDRSLPKPKQGNGTDDSTPKCMSPRLAKLFEGSLKKNRTKEDKGPTDNQTPQDKEDVTKAKKRLRDVAQEKNKRIIEAVVGNKDTISETQLKIVLRRFSIHGEPADDLKDTCFISGESYDAVTLREILLEATDASSRDELVRAIQPSVKSAMMGMKISYTKVSTSTKELNE